MDPRDGSASENFGKSILRRCEAPARAQPRHLVARYCPLQQVSLVSSIITFHDVRKLDICFRFSADGNYEVTIMTKAILNWNGKVEISNDKTLRIRNLGALVSLIFLISGELEPSCHLQILLRHRRRILSLWRAGPFWFWSVKDLPIFYEMIHQQPFTF